MCPGPLKTAYTAAPSDGTALEYLNFLIEHIRHCPSHTNRALPTCPHCGRWALVREILLKIWA